MHALKNRVLSLEGNQVLLHISILIIDRSYFITGSAAAAAAVFSFIYLFFC